VRPGDVRADVLVGPATGRVGRARHRRWQARSARRRGHRHRQGQ
jgi:hypothetical protein